MKTIFLLTFFLGITTQVWADVATECMQLSQNAYKACRQSHNACHDLGHCQERRKICNQDYQTKKGCQALHQCIADKFGKNNKGPCQYKWSGYSCSNKTIFRKLMSCPGSNSYSAPFTDYGFNCEGNKQFYQKQSKKCDEALGDYATRCRDQVNYVDFAPRFANGIKCDATKFKFSRLGETQGPKMKTFNSKRIGKPFKSDQIPEPDQDSSSSQYR